MSCLGPTRIRSSEPFQEGQRSISASTNLASFSWVAGFPETTVLVEWIPLIYAGFKCFDMIVSPYQDLLSRFHGSSMPGRLALSVLFADQLTAKSDTRFRRECSAAVD